MLLNAILNQIILRLFNFCTTQICLQQIPQIKAHYHLFNGFQKWIPESDKFLYFCRNLEIKNNWV
jgi:hypothetical protein